jgi:glycosyltransferase involved in cell wall biosynthesis
VLYVGPGPEAEHKGRHVLLDAWSRADVGNKKLVVVGGRERLSQNGAGVEDAGYLSGGDLAAAMAEAEFTVVPSVWPDPCPAVAVEPMALGRPVIASAVGGLTDIVQHESTGLLVPPDDPRALAEAIEALASNPGLVADLGRHAHRHAAGFATEAVLPQLEALYAQAKAEWP